MGCEACQLHVRAAIERSDGVIGSSVDFTTGKAQVVLPFVCCAVVCCVDYAPGSAPGQRLASCLATHSSTPRHLQVEVAPGWGFDVAALADKLEEDGFVIENPEHYQKQLQQAPADVAGEKEL